MKKLTFQHLSELGLQAQHNPRKRMNHNLHPELTDPIQRLAIAMEPETYVRPHRHPHTWELLTALRGRFLVLTFDERGVVLDRCVLGEEAAVVETGRGVWHAVLSLDVGGVIFEVKHGPYAPFQAQDLAPWSVEAEDPQHVELMTWYRTARQGDRWPEA